MRTQNHQCDHDLLCCIIHYPLIVFIQIMMNYNVMYVKIINGRILMGTVIILLWTLTSMNVRT